MRKYLTILFSMGLLSCGDGIPNDVLSVDKMQAVLTDVLLAEGFVENFELMDTTKKREDWYALEYSKVMTIHNISQDQFRRSLNFYKKNPDLFKIITDTVYQRSQRWRDGGFKQVKKTKLNPQ